MTANSLPDPNAIDDAVEGEIQACLNLDKLKSFFLYAGAGSGKTRSLVNALRWIRDTFGRRLLLQGQRIGVITYTNAACDEIKERMEFDNLIDVSTIHSFAWSLIGTYYNDIRGWLSTNLAADIAELVEAQRKGRTRTKATIEREASIRKKTERLAYIKTVKKFQYSPIGENRGRDALNHAEVISIAAAFIAGKPTLQSILIRRYPVLLVDESQDTNRFFMDALLAAQQKHQNAFCLGLFGDMMQRIYADGKVGLEKAIPPTWAKPAKKMNHRCPGRVLKLLNRMRSETDRQEQQGRTDKAEGSVRLFILPANTQDKSAVESRVTARMAEITGDDRWRDNYKALTLEHHMAAKRLGFSALFDPLYEVDRLRQGLLDGSLPALRFFSKQVLPLVESMRRGDQFSVAAVVKKYSPILDVEYLKGKKEQLTQLTKARDAVNTLTLLWNKSPTPLFGDVLDSIYRSGLFEIPELLSIVAARRAAVPLADDPESENERDESVKALDVVMNTPFEQIVAYHNYVTGISPFDTHQGVKGREFPRVIVVIDDEDARGFLFSYEKLFGVKDKSQTDLKHEEEGEETTIDRTRRLFYVTCSRAEDSLAIVNYTAEPSKARARVLAAGWFKDDEIVTSEF